MPGRNRDQRNGSSGPAYPARHMRFPQKPLCASSEEFGQRGQRPRSRPYLALKDAF